MDMQGYVERFGKTVVRAQNYWTSSPQAFPTFAEWRKNPDVQKSSIADTGPTIRAFVPVNSPADRSMMTRYEGTAAAFDARVVCIRPILKDWEFSSGNPSDENVPHGHFRGYVRPADLTDEIKKFLRYNHTKPGIRFDCIYDNIYFLPDPVFKICTVSYANGGLINSLDHTSNGSMDHYFSNEATLVYEQPWSFYDTWMAPDNQSHLRWPVQMGRTFLHFEAKGNATPGATLDFHTFNFTVNNKDV